MQLITFKKLLRVILVHYEMSSTSIARKNRRLQKQLSAKLCSSSPTVFSPNNLKSLSNNSKSYEVSNDDNFIHEDNKPVDIKLDADKLSTSLPSTGCSYINCDVSSRPTGKVFIEDDRGFKVIDASQMENFNIKYSSVDSSNNESAITLAYKAGKLFQNLSFFCHGLLGGMSLIHLLLLIHLMTSKSSEEDILRNFGFLSRPIHNIYNFLCMICCISAFDRYDIGNIKNSYRNMKKIQIDVCLIIIYPVCLLMSISTVNVDEKLWIPHFNATSMEIFTSKNALDEIFYWKTLSILKCVGSVIGWIVLCFYPKFNFFLTHLKSICNKNNNIH